MQTLNVEWIAGLRQSDGYTGIILHQSGNLNLRDALLAMWHHDATAAEIAGALEQLAADLRKQPA